MSTTDDNNTAGSSDEEITSNKKECTSCEQNNVDSITEGIYSIAALDDKSKCANCGKEGNRDDMNTCNKCKSVKYCNAACKKKHRSKHKKACERRAAERAAELHDEKLFKDANPKECPICMIPMPIETNTSTFKSCCGKIICDGCIHSMKMTEGETGLCPFCRTPRASTFKEEIIRIHKLIDKGNADANFMLAGAYSSGDGGLPQDHERAIELNLKAGELGCAAGYYNLGVAYRDGKGVEADKKKAMHYWELAAMMGDVNARYNIGVEEQETGNIERAMKHWIITAKAGDTSSLDAVKSGYTYGIITKDEYANTLRAYHERQKDMNSDERGKAKEMGRYGELVG